MEKTKRLTSLKSWYITIISLLIVGFFTYASIKKIADLAYIKYVIENYPLFTFFLKNILSSAHIAFIIIICEIGIVLTYLFWQIRLALFSSIFLIGLYVMNLISLVIENSFFDCGCGLFYISSNPSMMLTIDLLLIVIAVIAFQFSDTGDSPTLIKKIRSLK